ncbi:MAG: hypothetical protein MSIBF_06255 [Candidatus Altiarchaeales archaeon IMC4]|nr:MAG: hypothetical protein MSIBF_06255 [Candidatus Altiarchaeales archaeon IMC4]
MAFSIIQNNPSNIQNSRVSPNQIITEDDLYIPPEFKPMDIGGNQMDYTITKNGDNYTVEWETRTAPNFSYPDDDSMGVSASAGGSGDYAYLTSPRPRYVPLEIDGNIHFSGERFMVRAVIRNLREDPNNPAAVPANAIGVKASLRNHTAIKLDPDTQERTISAGDILIGQNKSVQWLVKATETGTHHICVDVADIYKNQWEGCADVKAIASPRVNIMYIVPQYVTRGEPFDLVAEITNPMELTVKDFSITLAPMKNIYLFASESAAKHVGDIAPRETKTVSWRLVSGFSGEVVGVAFETIYEGGPVGNNATGANDTCFNGVQDAGELGVDCGGVCTECLPDMGIFQNDILFALINENGQN